MAHPLDPLSPEEMSALSLAIKQHIAASNDGTKKVIKFLTANILLPPKKAVMKYLGVPLTQDDNTNVENLKRCAECDLVDLVAGTTWNARAILDSTTTPRTAEWKVYEFTQLPDGVQPQITPQELVAAEETVRSDPRVQKLAAAVGVTPEQIYADGWSIGYDARFPKTTRLQQCLVFARFGKDENLYAHPMDFFPVIDSNTLKVIHIDFAAHRIPSPNSPGPLGLSSNVTASFPLDSNALEVSGRDRFPPPLANHDYLPDLLAQQPDHKPSIRPPLKPLHVSQPEGVSFSMDGNVIEWQNWKLHAAFSHKEGIALSTITYNDGGVVRPLFYRLSLVEMVVPYAAPEHPHPRKFAFDVGEYGMGTQANELTLGCDCLGTIHYLPGSYIGNDGTPIHVRNAICIHEEDAGLLWKHTDFRPGGRVHSVRSRRLVISMICTVANYEYCFYYYFYQDGSIELEVRLTGILNVYLLADGEKPDPFGIQVAQGINAQHHQHIFSLRIDPIIDGISNSVVETDIVPYDFPAGSKENFAGNAFLALDTVIKEPTILGRKFDAGKDRRWRIVNPVEGKKHPASGKAPGYAIGIKGAAIELLAKPDSWASKRAAFARGCMWVVPERKEDGSDYTKLEDERLWPAGKYVPQTRDDPEDSLVGWAKKGGGVDGEDILVFVTVGVNHIPRPEDWPVMPVEHLRMTLKPVNFFIQNPALDVPGGLDIKSSHAFGAAGGASVVNGTNGTNGHGCECDSE